MTLQMAVGVVVVVTLIEAVRRSTAPALALLMVAALGYAAFGHHLPGFLYHRPFSFERLIEISYLLDDEGMPEEARERALVRLLKQFHNVLIYILLAAAVLTAVLGEWIDTGVILAVVLVNALIGFVQEGKAEAALEGIRRMLSLEATVIREGHRLQVPAEELVPGDVVLLESGGRVPADLRLLSARNARIEEAALTGESVPAATG